MENSREVEEENALSNERRSQERKRNLSKCAVKAVWGRCAKEWDQSDQSGDCLTLIVLYVSVGNLNG